MRGGKAVLLCATALAFGCPSVDKDPPITESANTIARFAPDSANRCNSVLPFPSDLSKDPTTGKLNLPFCADDTPTLSAFKMGLNTLNGFSINGTMTADFTADLDSSTIDGSVVIINTVTGAPHPIGQTLYVASDKLLTIFPGAPFDEETRYIVAIGNSLKDADGGEIISDAAFTIMKSDTPLVDADGYSVIGQDDATANGLEQLRLGWQPLFAAADAAGTAMGSTAFTKENVLVVWSFTTQTVTTSYGGLAAVVAGGASADFENTIAAEDHLLLTGQGIPTFNVCKIHTGRMNLKSLLTEAQVFAKDAAGDQIMSDQVAEYMLYTPNPDPNPLDTTPARVHDCSAATGSDFDAAGWQGVVVFAHTLSRCKNVSVTLANTFGTIGWAVLAVDGPRGGGRSVNNFGDQDGDTCPDQPGTPEIISLGGTPNPFHVRDRMRQWGLELVQIAELAKADMREFGATAAGGAPTPDVALVGHSWGGMAGVLAGSVSTDIDLMVLNSASGGMGTMFTPLLRAGIAAQMGLDPTSADPVLERETETVVQIYTWAMEPADPLYAAQVTPASLPVLDQVVAVPGTHPGADLHYTATQAVLGAALEARGMLSSTATVTFECNAAGGGTESVCFDDDGVDDALGVVGALLQPCEGNDFAAGSWTVALHKQIVGYLASSGTVVAPATTPDCAP